MNYAERALRNELERVEAEIARLSNDIAGLERKVTDTRQARDSFEDGAKELHDAPKEMSE